MQRFFPFLLAAILAGAGSHAATGQSGQGGPQTLPSPPRMGNTANDQGGLESAFNIARDEKSRMQLLADEKRQIENWQAAERFASCAVGFNESRARQLLDQAVEGKSGRRVDIGDFVNRNQGCVVAVGGLDRDILRGALAEELLTENEGTYTISAAGDAGMVRAFIASVKTPNAKTDDPFTVGQIAAECRTALAPFQVRGLLETEPGSPGEKGALTVLREVTPQCDSFRVEGHELTPYFERAFLAQALYHWIGFSGGEG